MMKREGEHTLNWRKTQFLCNLSVLNLASIIQAHSAHQLGEIARAGNGRTTAKSLELDVGDGVCLGVNADLELHDISAGGRTDESRADVDVLLVHGADIARARVVVEDLFVVVALEDCGG